MTGPTGRDWERARALRFALLQFIRTVTGDIDCQRNVSGDGQTDEVEDRIDAAIASALAEARVEERVICIATALDYMKRAGIGEHAEKFVAAIRQGPTRKESAG